MFSVLTHPSKLAEDQIKVFVNDRDTGWINISIYPLPKDNVSAYGCRLRYIQRYGGELHTVKLLFNKRALT